jgi:DNA-binding NarL/FixJ family response regulator
MMLNVLLVEDHTLVRSGIRALLEKANPDLKVVGEADDGQSAVELVRQLNPQLVLMDVAMPGLNGIEATRQIRAAHPQVRILMLSMHDDPQYVDESMRSGANGYVLKGAAFQELLAAIAAVMDGQSYLSTALSERASGRAIGPTLEPASGEVTKLSAREREVLQHIAEGKSSAEVAELLQISVRTVDTHRHNIMSKLGIHSIAGLTKFAIRHGLCMLS